MLRKILSAVLFTVGLGGAPVLAMAQCACGDQCLCEKCECDHCPHHAR